MGPSCNGDCPGPECNIIQNCTTGVNCTNPVANCIGANCTNPHNCTDPNSDCFEYNCNETSCIHDL